MRLVAFQKVSFVKGILSVRPLSDLGQFVPRVRSGMHQVTFKMGGRSQETS